MQPSVDEYTGAVSSGYDSTLSAGYAPADFPDADATRPASSYIDSGSHAPATIYSTAINNSLQRHFKDIKDHQKNVQQISSSWKKSVRDLFFRGNETIFTFLTKPIGNHPTFSQTELFIRRFSRNDMQNNSGTILRDVLNDLSDINLSEGIEASLRKKAEGKPPIEALGAQVKEVYQIYREAFDEITQVDLSLRTKLQTLDKIQPRLTLLLELGVNEDTAELQKNIEVYLEKVYQENSPEADYKKLLLLYKKMGFLKELMTLLRLNEFSDKEPICSICLNEQISYVLTPCGHTFCEVCMKRQLNQCYICRGSVRDRVKIYF
jgi:hypothetical protein